MLNKQKDKKKKNKGKRKKKRKKEKSAKGKKNHNIGNIFEKIDRFLSHESSVYLKATQIKHF